jgi:DHA1 family inner membrane transport protein
VSDAWRREDALLLMAVLSALALAMVIRWIHVPRIEESQLQSTLDERLRAVCRPDLVRALLSYLLVFGGIMAVFSYLASFLVRYTQFPSAYVTPVLALYSVADIVGNLVSSKRIPNQLEEMFKRLLVVLAFSLTAISLFGA